MTPVRIVPARGRILTKRHIPDGAHPLLTLQYNDLHLASALQLRPA
jgi:hypothetical protein